MGVNPPMPAPLTDGELGLAELQRGLCDRIPVFAASLTIESLIDLRDLLSEPSERRVERQKCCGDDLEYGRVVGVPATFIAI